MILLIASGEYFSDYGGGQVYVKSLVNSLRAQRCACCVLSITRTSGADRTRIVSNDDEGVTVWQLSVPRIPTDPQQPSDLQAPLLEALRKMLLQIKPSVVHAHGAKVAAAAVCHELSIPCIITAHHGGLVCPNGTLLHWQGHICKQPVSRRDCLRCTLHALPGGGFWGPIVRALPEFVSVPIARALQHISNIPFTSPAFLAPAAIVRKQAEIEVLKTRSAVLVAPSAAMAEALQRNGIPSSRIQVIPHGIPALQRKPLPVDRGQRPLRLIFIGRICAGKGVHLLLEALEGIPPDLVELHIVGGAVTRPEERYLAGLQKHFVAGNIHWHGKCPPDRVEQWLAHCHVMVHPAIYLEVFGLTIAEAMAMGRPVIASRCGGPEDILSDGVNGFLIPPNDAVALAAAIERFIQEPDLLSRLASQIGQVNSIQEHVGDLLRLYARASSTKKLN